MLVKNALAYINGKFRKKDILIKGKRIVKIASLIEEKEEIVNANNLIVFPGLIDIHAHLREPGQTQKEDFLTGSRSALAGGYALVYDMPNNFPMPTITAEALKKKIMLAKKALCEIRFHFGTTKTNFKEIEKATPESLKIYMGKTTGKLILDDIPSILMHMKKFPKEKPIFVHAIDNTMLEKDADKAFAAGVYKAITLARIAKRKVHITHAGSAREIEIAKSYEGASVDCTPHHLFLSKEEAEKFKPRELGLVQPPLQTEREILLMWKKLEQIDAIGTDHAPHLFEEKCKGAQGFPGLETALALFLDAYNLENRVSLEWIATRFSENPAKIMGLMEYGKIYPGFFANITFVDLKHEWVVRAEKMHSKAQWSPFEGKKLKGKVVKTIYKGKLFDFTEGTA